MRRVLVCGLLLGCSVSVAHENPELIQELRAIRYELCLARGVGGVRRETFYIACEGGSGYTRFITRWPCRDEPVVETDGLTCEQKGTKGKVRLEK